MSTLPVVSRTGDKVEQADSRTIRIIKPKGSIMIRLDALHSFEALPKERTFNLVPGFECVPLVITMQPGKEITIQLEVSSS
jgi:hypothetical protein